MLKFKFSKKTTKFEITSLLDLSKGDILSIVVGIICPPTHALSGSDGPVIGRAKEACLSKNGKEVCGTYKFKGIKTGFAPSKIHICFFF